MVKYSRLRHVYVDYEAATIILHIEYGDYANGAYTTKRTSSKNQPRPAHDRNRAPLMVWTLEFIIVMTCFGFLQEQVEPLAWCAHCKISYFLRLFQV